MGHCSAGEELDGADRGSMMSDKVRPEQKRLDSMSFFKSDPELAQLERRSAVRHYSLLLPDLHPVKLGADHIAVDFLVAGPGAATGAVPASPRGTLTSAAMAGAGVFDTRVAPRRVLAWLHSMPAYRAGVPVHLGRHSDAGLAFEKVEELLGLLDPGRAITYFSRRPLGPAERAYFATPRSHLLLELSVAPRCAPLGHRLDPLELVRSAAGLDPRRLHLEVGPISAEGLADAARIVEALPAGTRLTLSPWEGEAAAGLHPLPPGALDGLTDLAAGRGLTVTPWRCREGLARVGRGFPEVDRLTGQQDLGRRALDLITCGGCPSRTQCHGDLDEAALQARLGRELRALGLTSTAPLRRTGPRSLLVEVAEPTAPGDQAYLSFALGQVVAVTLASPASEPRTAGPGAAVLRRWYATGFLPVTELNAAAERALEDLGRLQASWTGEGGQA